MPDQEAINGKTTLPRYTTDDCDNKYQTVAPPVFLLYRYGPSVLKR